MGQQEIHISLLDTSAVLADLVVDTLIDHGFVEKHRFDEAVAPVKAELDCQHAAARIILGSGANRVRQASLDADKREISDSGLLTSERLAKLIVEALIENCFVDKARLAKAVESAVWELDCQHAVGRVVLRLDGTGSNAREAGTIG